MVAIAEGGAGRGGLVRVAGMSLSSVALLMLVAVCWSG